MKTVSLQITYRKGKPFAAYIYLSRQNGQKSVRTEVISEDLLIDYAQDETPLGIEIVSPEMVSIDEIQAVFDPKTLQDLVVEQLPRRQRQPVGKSRAQA